MRLRRGLAIGLLLALAAATPAAAFTPYESYNYNAWGESVPMPSTYEVEQVAGLRPQSSSRSPPTYCT